jgi:hypothetical protein
MSKKRKLHELKGTIKGCWPGQVNSKSQWRGQNFYCLDIVKQNLFTEQEKETLYAFPNLVSKDLWKTLEQQSFKDKSYLFFCEKRVRGWRLKNWEEIS